MSDGHAHLPVRTGDVIGGKYRVEAILGEGGMGFVVAARHLTLDQLVAVKLLLPIALQSEEIKGRFLREARAVGALTSDHVARVLDFGTNEAGVPFLVMEHLSGDTLGALTERAPIPVRDAITFLLEVGEALTEAHALGIVHRDLKPDNVFIVRKPNGKRYAKVLDFGVSRIDNAAIAGGRALTATGASVGTPAFMAPEQITPKKAPGPKVDVWALGVTLYNALSNRLPFEAESVYELTVKIYAEAPISIRAHRPDLPDALVALLDDCLKKDPDARPALPEVLARLEAVRAGEPQRTSGPSDAAAVIASSGRMNAATAARPISDATLALETRPVTPNALPEPTLHLAPPPAPPMAAPMRTSSALSRTPFPKPRKGQGALIAAIVVPIAVVLSITAVVAIKIRHRQEAPPIATLIPTAEPAPPPSLPAPEAPTEVVTAPPPPSPSPVETTEPRPAVATAHPKSTAAVHPTATAAPRPTSTTPSAHDAGSNALTKER